MWIKWVNFQCEWLNLKVKKVVALKTYHYMRTSLVPGYLEGPRNVPNVRPDGSATGLTLKSTRVNSAWAVTLGVGFKFQQAKQTTIHIRRRRYSKLRETFTDGPTPLPSRPLLPIKMIRWVPALIMSLVCHLNHQINNAIFFLLLWVRPAGPIFPLHDAKTKSKSHQPASHTRPHR